MVEEYPKVLWSSAASTMGKVEVTDLFLFVLLKFGGYLQILCLDRGQ